MSSYTNKEEDIFYDIKPDEVIRKGYKKARKVMESDDKVEVMLQRLENRLKNIPKVGTILADVPCLIALVRNYIRKEYTQIPAKSVIAIVSTLIYLLTPVDLIPDAIPGIGYIDDAAVLAACMKFVDMDVKQYQQWRSANGRDIDV